MFCGDIFSYFFCFVDTDINSFRNNFGFYKMTETQYRS